MTPQVISLKLDRRIVRAGVTLAQIVDAFVAQLSTPAPKRPGIASKTGRPRAKARVAT